MTVAARMFLGMLVGVAMVGAGAGPALALSEDEMLKIIQEVDARQKAVGDWKAHAFLQQKQKDKEDVVYESVFFRRGADKKFMFLVLAPKTEAGQGYLQVDDNLWMYSPRTGKWERVTERDRIMGTDGRRQDFDESRLADEYTPSFLGDGQIKKYETWRIRLTVKSGKDVAWPIIDLEIDKASGNVLKRQEFSLSDKLMRTTMYPRWVQVKDPSGKDVWYPEQIYLFDEVEKGNQSIVKIDAVDLSELPRNIFTKAWLESKSR